MEKDFEKKEAELSLKKNEISLQLLSLLESEVIKLDGLCSIELVMFAESVLTKTQKKFKQRHFKILHHLLKFKTLINLTISTIVGVSIGILISMFLFY